MWLKNGILTQKHLFLLTYNPRSYLLFTLKQILSIFVNFYIYTIMHLDLNNTFRIDFHSWLFEVS